MELGRQCSKQRLRSRQRALSVPTARQRKDRPRSPRRWSATDPYEIPGDWHGLGHANLDPAFLFPGTENSKCPINKNVRKHTSEANAEYMLCIPNVDKKDERVYCPYCDVKNHLRWTCTHLDKSNMSDTHAHCALAITHRSFAHLRDATMDQESLTGLRQRRSKRRTWIENQTTGGAWMVFLRQHLLPNKLKLSPWILLAHHLHNNKHHQQKQLPCVQPQQLCIQPRRSAHRQSLLPAHLSLRNRASQRDHHQRWLA